VAIAVGLLCSCASLVLIAAVAWMNYRFMAGLGASESDGLVLGMASLAVDSLFALLGPLVLWGRRHGLRYYAWAATVLAAACGALSFLSALGFAVDGRDRAQNRHETEHLAIEAAARRRQALQETRRGLGSPPPRRLADARVAGLEADPRWAASAGCTRSAVVALRGWCAAARRLLEEQATAQEAERLDGEIDAALSEWIALRRQTGRSLVDVQLSMLAEFSGWAENSVRLGLSTLAALVLIGGAGFGLALGLAPLEIYLEERRRRRLRKPSGEGHLAWSDVTGPAANGVEPEASEAGRSRSAIGRNRRRGQAVPDGSGMERG
jgi:hypothetical protein